MRLRASRLVGRVTASVKVGLSSLSVERATRPRTAGSGTAGAGTGTGGWAGAGAACCLGGAAVAVRVGVRGKSHNDVAGRRNRHSRQCFDRDGPDAVSGLMTGADQPDLGTGFSGE